MNNKANTKLLQLLWDQKTLQTQIIGIGRWLCPPSEANKRPNLSIHDPPEVALHRPGGPAPQSANHCGRLKLLGHSL